MKSVSLSGSRRENVGKKDAKMLRNKGLVPAVIYGGKDQLFFSVSEKEFDKVYFSPEVFAINLDIDGVKKTATIQEVQIHPTKDEPIHIDFLEVIDGKPITVALPIVITGTAPGVLRGGKLTKKARKLRVSGLLNDVPENITVDISTLNVGDAIRVKDIKKEGLTFLDFPSNVVVTVRTARGLADDDSAAASSDAE
ncbi:MAG: 50S ribosomal protein L25 [Bacteroidales bacterium]|nr:50S ribosomal protein L25 [Bacteroidales bacterium]